MILVQVDEASLERVRTLLGAINPTDRQFHTSAHCARVAISSFLWLYKAISSGRSFDLNEIVRARFEAAFAEMAERNGISAHKFLELVFELGLSAVEATHQSEVA